MEFADDKMFHWILDRIKEGSGKRLKQTQKLWDLLGLVLSRQ